MPNRLSQFWQELKRRKVTRVVTVYAAAAFVIIELVDIVAPNLGLPTWTFNFILILLFVGFVITVIVSWIYDIHPEGGIVKTEPAYKVKAEDIPKSSNSWKIASYISFAVIVAMAGILLYPKIFKPDRLRELRDEEGMISIVVLPFDNLTGDSSLYFWQSGISEYLINKLGSSQELAVSSSQLVSDVLAGTREVNTTSLSPNIAMQIANKIDATTYITGKFIGKENDASIMLNLVNAENGKLIWSTSVSGDLGTDYRAVLNHLSDTVRNYMEIRALEGNAETDFSNAYPNSAEAYRHYVDGLNAIVASNYEMAVESLLKAYELDTTFTFAAFYLAYAYAFDGLPNDEERNKWINRAHELIENIPQAYHPWIKMWYACSVERDDDVIRRYCNMMYDAELHSRFLWFDLGVTYYSFLDDYSKAISAFEKLEALNQRWEDNWKYDRYYGEYTWVLLMADRPEEVGHIADIGLKINPKNDQLVRRKGAAAIMMGDSAEVILCREDFMSLAKENGYTEAVTEFLLGNMHRWANDYRQAADYYRRAYELDNEYLSSLKYLIYSQLRGDFSIEECLRLSEYGLEQDPESMMFLWGKGFSLHRLGRDQEALAILLPMQEQLPYNRELQRDIQEVQHSLALQEQ